MVATSAITTVPQSQQLASFQPEDAKLKRMVVLMKAGIKAPNASEAEFVALATLCMAHNLDPYNGEAWIIPGNGVMTGIKGLRKAADAQLPAGAHKIPALRLLQHSEYDAYGITGEVKMAFLCELTRTDATQQWVDQLTQLCKIGMTYIEALAQLGPRPVWIGVGIVRPGDKSKMPLDQLGRKRAEADALKRAFNLPFNIDLSHENGDGGAVVDAEWAETDGRRDPQTDPEAGGHAETIPGGEEPAELVRPYDPETVRKGIKSRIEHNPTAHDKPASEKQRGYVASMLNKAFEESATADKDRHAVTEWLVGKKSVKDLTAAEAKALIDWLADESGDLSYEAFQEANGILRAAMVEQGQIDMFGAGLAGGVEE